MLSSMQCLGDDKLRQDIISAIYNLEQRMTTSIETAKDVEFIEII